MPEHIPFPQVFWFSVPVMQFACFPVQFISLTFQVIIDGVKALALQLATCGICAHEIKKCVHYDFAMMLMMIL